MAHVHKLSYMAGDLIRRLANHEVTQQFLRFAAVGAVATVAHYGVLIALKELAHVPILWATSAGYLLGAVVGYVLNRRFTFRANNNFATGLAKYVAIGVIGLLLNGAITTGLTHTGLFYLLSQMIATGVVMFWNFAAARLIIFR